MFFLLRSYALRGSNGSKTKKLMKEKGEGAVTITTHLKPHSIATLEDAWIEGLTQALSRLSASGMDKEKDKDGKCKEKKDKDKDSKDCMAVDADAAPAVSRSAKKRAARRRAKAEASTSLEAPSLNDEWADEAQSVRSLPLALVPSAPTPAAARTLKAQRSAPRSPKRAGELSDELGTGVANVP